jgi:acylphosphatase
MRNYTIIVKGKVQKVSYRFSAQQMAIRLKLTGYVKNMANGDVMIEAEGTEENINRLIEWCYVGPPLAEVEEVIPYESDWKGYKTFELKRL